MNDDEGNGILIHQQPLKWTPRITNQSVDMNEYLAFHLLDEYEGNGIFILF